ncbi:MAG: hypothetical protein IPM51_11730 [Sphingobacteriaceae bacterium]|nr:hypothetical protein [Sphingobacteriaceae bacterium]
MKILKTPENVCIFEKIPINDVFEYEGFLYLKTNAIFNSQGDQYNAVGITTNVSPCYIYPTMYVIHYPNAVLHLNKASNNENG